MSVRPSHHRPGTTAYIPEHPARYPVQKSDDSIKVSSKLLSPKYSGRHKTTIPELWEISSPSPPFRTKTEARRPCPSTATENQSCHPKPTDNTLQYQASRNCIPQPLDPCRDPHRNTPLNPLSRGETSHSTHSLPTKKQLQNLPSREGKHNTIPPITNKKRASKSPFWRGEGVCDSEERGLS